MTVFKVARSEQAERQIYSKNVRYEGHFHQRRPFSNESTDGLTGWMDVGHIEVIGDDIGITGEV